MSIFDLTGSTVLVTGGNGGIGLGMAEGLAAAGADVCIWGRNPAKNTSAMERIRSFGGRAAAMEVDVTDAEAVQGAFEAVVAEFGKVDACFANAGVGAGITRFHEMSTEEWEYVLRVNLDGVFHTFQAAVRHLRQRDSGGSLVVTSSMAALQGMPRGEHYAAAKAGVIAMVKGLAVEYGRYGIRANAVLPGWIESDMTGGIFVDERFTSRVLPRIPAGRWGTPGDFAGIAVYLASDASRYHTGDAILIDGGYTQF